MEWINAKDKLPEKEQKVLFVTSITNDVHLGWVDNDGDFEIDADEYSYYENEKVKYWMEIPVPPID